MKHVLKASLIAQTDLGRRVAESHSDSVRSYFWLFAQASLLLVLRGEYAMAEIVSNLATYKKSTVTPALSFCP